MNGESGNHEQGGPLESLAGLSMRHPPSLLVLLGLVIAGLSIAQLWIDPQPLRIQALKVGVPLALTVPMFYIAARTPDSPRAGPRQKYTVGLGLLFAGIALATVTLILWAEVNRPVSPADLYFPLVMSTAAGSSVGCSAGVIFDEWQATKEQLAEEVDRTQKLNQRLRVVNRLLRHNVRNALNIALASLGDVRREFDDPGLLQTANKCHTALTNLHQQTEKAGYINKLEDISPQQTTLDVDALVTDVLESRELPDEGVEITRDLSGGAEIRAHPLVRVAIREALDNALSHNTPDGLTIDVTVTASAETVTVAVADNGAGLSPSERIPLELEKETELEHGSGIGLWLIKWIADSSDGEFQLSEAEDGGAEVRMTFPRA
jgi:signal transduction histidine kinase